MGKSGCFALMALLGEDIDIYIYIIWVVKARNPLSDFNHGLASIRILYLYFFIYFTTDSSIFIFNILNKIIIPLPLLNFYISVSM